MRSLYLLLGGWVLGWILHDWFYNAVSHQVQAMIDKSGLEYREVFHSFTDPFMLKMKVSFCIGLFFVGPLVITQLWGFVTPGLKPHERRPFRIIGPISMILFLMGAFLCWLILPVTVQWFVDFAKSSFPHTQILQEAGTMVFFVINMLLGFGIGFQLPLVVYFLSYIGVLPPDQIHKYWRQAVVVIFFVAAIVTPSQDPLSMSMMAIPLCILFMGSVLAVRITEKRRIRARGQDPAEVIIPD